MSEPSAEVRYKITEVCRIADVQPYVLRYWESEFTSLTPDRTAPGPRLYTARDLRVIARIKKLLYDEGYTIAGAKKRLESEIKAGALDVSSEPPPVPPPPAEPAAIPLAAAEASAPAEAGSPAETTAPASAPASAPTRRRRVATQPVQPSLDELELEAPVKQSDTKEVVPLAAEPATPPKPAFTPDPRLARTVSELREIQQLLTRNLD